MSAMLDPARLGNALHFAQREPHILYLTDKWSREMLPLWSQVETMGGLTSCPALWK